MKILRLENFDEPIYAVQYKSQDDIFPIKKAIKAFGNRTFSHFLHNDREEFYFPGAIPFDVADEENLKSGDYFVFSPSFLMLFTENEIKLHYNLRESLEITLPVN